MQIHDNKYSLSKLREGWAKRRGLLQQSSSTHPPVSMPFIAGGSALQLGQGVFCWDAPGDPETVLVGEWVRSAALHVGNGTSSTPQLSLTAAGARGPCWNTHDKAQF